MKLKEYIETELQKLEKQQESENSSNYLDTLVTFERFKHIGYIQGKIDALKWVLSKED